MTGATAAAFGVAVHIGIVAVQVGYTPLGYFFSILAGLNVWNALYSLKKDS